MTDTKKAWGRIARYVKMRRLKPLVGLGDGVHSIHTGTEWAAESLLSDLEKIVAEHEGALPSPPGRSP